MAKTSRSNNTMASNKQTVKEMMEAKCVSCGDEEGCLFHDYFNNNDEIRSWFCRPCFIQNRKDEVAPKCEKEGCECDAAPDGGRYWKLCVKCHQEEKDEEEEDENEYPSDSEYDYWEAKLGGPVIHCGGGRWKLG